MHLLHFLTQKVYFSNSPTFIRIVPLIDYYNYCFKRNLSMYMILLDDEEDEEDEAYYTDAFDGMKQRMTTLNGKTEKMEKV